MSKPGKVELWFYELCCKLCTDDPYMLYTRLQQSRNGESITCEEIVGQWCDSIQNVGKVDHTNPNLKTILVFDSYYIYKDVRALLPYKNIIYSASCCKMMILTMF